MVAFIHCTEEEKVKEDRLTELVIRKHRNGPLKDIPLIFQTATSTFVNVANNVNMLSMSISIISLLVTQLLFIFMCMIVGLVIGYRFNENRDIKTFLIFVALYIVSRIIMVLIIGSLNLDYYLYSTLFFIILNLLFYFYGRELFKKGVNLE